MKLCGSCHRASGAGSVYCGGCGRTFGVKLCDNKHANAPSPAVQFCTTCGSTQLSEPTRYLNLNWAAPLLSLLVALGAWRWSIAHGALLGRLLECLVLDALAVLLDTTPCGVIGGARCVASWALALWLMGWMMALLPGRGGTIGTWLRSLPQMAVKLSMRGGQTLLRLSGHALRRAFWPTPRRTKSAPTNTHD